MKRDAHFLPLLEKVTARSGYFPRRLKRRHNKTGRDGTGWPVPPHTRDKRASSSEIQPHSAPPVLTRNTSPSRVRESVHGHPVTHALRSGLCSADYLMH